jgi:hypothetical protein
MVPDPDTFGRRERRIVNQSEIEETIAANKVILDAYAEEKKDNPNAEPPELLDAEEPIVEEESESLKELFQSQNIGPFEKTQAIMVCIGRTEYANLVLNCAEYKAGRARMKKILQLVTEIDISSDDEHNFVRKWKSVEDIDNEDPQLVGYLESIYNVYQSEVFSEDFLQKLLSAARGGGHRN